MHHFTEHNIRVHVFTCVLALAIAHPMRRHAAQHGLHMSVRELLDTLAGIQETVLIYPGGAAYDALVGLAARDSRLELATTYSALGLAFTLLPA